MAFRYWVIYKDERRQTPRNVFVINRDDHRLDTVSWSYLDRAWRHDRSVLGYLFSGDRNDASETTREHAEEVARDLGIQPLPSEQEVMRITDEARAESS